MLGKGLESLIPQKGGQGQGKDAGQTPASQQPAQPTQPVQAAQPAQPAQSAQQPQPNPGAQPQLQSQPSFSHQPQAQPRPQIQQSSPLIPKKDNPTPAVAQHQPQPQSQKSAQPQQESIFHIEVEKITPNPDQPRRNFDQEGLRDLANSIREFGMLQPIVVSKIKKEAVNGIEVEYQIIAGERRYMAAKLLGLARVPAVVRNVNLEREKLELGVIENIQRENLNPIEMARAFQRLQEEFRMTQREIAAKLGKSREVVANAVRLLDLPEDIQKAVEEGTVSESNARMLLALEDPGMQRKLLDEIVNEKLTTRDVRERIARYAFVQGREAAAAEGGNLGIVPGMTGSPAINAPRRGRPPLKPVHLPPEVKMLKEELATELGAPIDIQKTAHNGKITITFFSEEELENILRKLGGRE